MKILALQFFFSLNDMKLIISNDKQLSIRRSRLVRDDVSKLIKSNDFNEEQL